MATDIYTIGEAARRVGLNPKMIRYYEKIGLIPAAPRRESGYHAMGYRLFRMEDLGRLELVAKARSLGTPVREVRELLQCVEAGCCSTVRPEVKELLARRLKELDEKLVMLTALRKQVEQLYRLADDRGGEPLEQCPPGATPCTCAFPTPVQLNLKRR